MVRQAGFLCPAFTITTSGQIGIRQAIGKIYFPRISEQLLIQGFLHSGGKSAAFGRNDVFGRDDF